MVVATLYYVFTIYSVYQAYKLNTHGIFSAVIAFILLMQSCYFVKGIVDKDMWGGFRTDKLWKKIISVVYFLTIICTEYKVYISSGSLIKPLEIAILSSIFLELFNKISEKSALGFRTEIVWKKS